MMQNRYKYFRWNRRTGTVTFMFAVVVPAIVGYIGYTTDVSSCWPLSALPDLPCQEIGGMEDWFKLRLVSGADLMLARVSMICGRSGGVIQFTSGKKNRRRGRRARERIVYTPCSTPRDGDGPGGIPYRQLYQQFCEDLVADGVL